MQTNYKDVSEENYRSQYIKQDRAQVRKVVRIMLWAFIPLMLVDVLFHDFDLTLAALVIMRVPVFVYSLWLIRQYGTIENVPLLDSYALRWIVLVLLTQFISNTCLPTDYFGHYMVDAWLVLMAFISLPLALQALRIPLFVFVAASCFLVLYKQSSTFSQAASVVLILPAIAITGHAIAAYVHRYRKKLLSAEQELERQANCDPVTGVANWREFMRISDAELQRHLRLGKQLSMLVLDLEDFKHINDLHGPQVGDVILVEVSRRVKRVMRSYDCIARFSGEEFCVLLPEASAQDARRIADRTRATVIAMPISVSGREMKVNATVRTATLREGDTASSLLQRAGESQPSGKQEREQTGNLEAVSV
ncbi:GGDEF domain-containing protein [Undibacterium sp. TJN19]|uniref:GGDEF domain-containing protein n=1 Tax=Undibacterium sp. TJN19 TaxID=3413055 RepID=UPI003BF24785